MAPSRRKGQLDITRLLRRSDLTNDEVRAVEATLGNKDVLIAQHLRSLKTNEDRVTALKEELAEAQGISEGLQEELTETKENSEMKDGLLRLGGQALDKRAEEVEQLRTQLNERDAQLHQLSIAAQDDAGRIANEISARRTLNIIEGFKTDVAERDSKIAELEREVEKAKEDAKEARGIAIRQQKMFEKLVELGMRAEENAKGFGN